MDIELLKKLNAGAKKILKNAVALNREAILLGNNKSWSRALFLHQISLEECAKIEVLGASATTLFMGGKVSFKDIADVFRSHAKKNLVNAYFLEPSAKERSAGQSGQFREAITAFKFAQDRFHSRSNLEKNAALYVDLKDDDFTAPVDRITTKMVARIRKINEKFLLMTADKAALLQSYELNPAKYVRQVQDFKAAMNKIADGNPESLGKSLQEFVDRLLINVPKAK